VRLNELTAHELHGLILKGEASSCEATASCFDRIDEVEGDVEAFLSLNREEALRQAKLVDQKVRRGEPISPLAGIPIAIKDNICVDGMLTTCASRILANFRPPYDATVVARLREAGLVFMGKTNLDEFAMGSSTENSAFKVTHNPWDISSIPGGSSGGSAASVACHETILAIGSDTGGSIRQPASLCGVVGMKPTYGRVSRYGLVAFASSLDQIGPITKDIQDCALLMNVICGHDHRDSTSVELPVPEYTESLVDSVKGVKIGIPSEYFVEGMDPEVERAIKDAIKLLEELGANVGEASLPHTEYAIACYYLLATAEASSNLARYDGVRYGYRTQNSELRMQNAELRTQNSLLEMYERTRGEGFGQEVKRRIMLGTYALSAGYYDAYYLKAQKVRTLIREDFDRAFEEFDVLVAPTSPTPAFKVGEKIGDPLKMYLSDIFTISVNLAGIPGISIPCGFSESGLPIGLQILGRPFGEEAILRVAYAYQANTDFHRARPKVGKD